MPSARALTFTPAPVTTVVVRHGATDWAAADRHTGREDVALNDDGRRQARSLGTLLDGLLFSTVWVSPLTRARETCELSGFGDRAVVVEDLVEWDYGDFEGLTDAQTRARDPGWSLFADGAPGGERPGDVERRVRAVIDALHEAPGPRIVFSHGKTLRALAAIWLGQPISVGEALACDPAAVGFLERDAGRSLLRLWNLQPPL